MVAQKQRLFIVIIGIVLIIIFVSSLSESRERITSKVESTWLYHGSPEEAGFSSAQLDAAKKYYDSIGSTAAMVIYNGKVLVSWGDVTKKSNIHSVRKSLLSALYGIHVAEGTINLQSSLKQLNVSDHMELTEQEKQARVVDLLTSRSGVFLTAGQESWLMRWKRPDREVYPPGSHFYYNNWDFNVLGTIFTERTQRDIFEEFKDRIADPIGMEDYTEDDWFYKFELNRSLHPSYLFRMSARDMARFGQLYLQNGVWEGEQMIPVQWIEESTSVHTPTANAPYGYGYMWWVADSGYFRELGLYSAIGRYGQSIDIIPSENLVFVHRVDSDKLWNRAFKNVSDRKRLKLLEMILDAKMTNEL
ncbi:serine hydrolase domain-containing protein [Desertibacillus haloalkaliphilus]|uniref:serine hydrolase domain-containing protein n=1 Tax=Desertibacillus haloalkaliphilus TaxID=1328930 RepID=UPI001C25CA24|nr:serine hydrolase [Desertibacillus haloalkaliphilus]MBU8906024.1 beta-lactamase family protein [Desertibacillus haloalkaliphilus]